jgi:hypothetical protein
LGVPPLDDVAGEGEAASADERQGQLATPISAAKGCGLDQPLQQLLAGLFERVEFVVHRPSAREDSIRVSSAVLRSRRGNTTPLSIQSDEKQHFAPE